MSERRRVAHAPAPGVQEALAEKRLQLGRIGASISPTKRSCKSTPLFAASSSQSRSPSKISPPAKRPKRKVDDDEYEDDTGEEEDDFVVPDDEIESDNDDARAMGMKDKEWKCDGASKKKGGKRRSDDGKDSGEEETNPSSSFGDRPEKGTPRSQRRDARTTAQKESPEKKKSSQRGEFEEDDDDDEVSRHHIVAAIPSPPKNLSRNRQIVSTPESAGSSRENRPNSSSSPAGGHWMSKPSVAGLEAAPRGTVMAAVAANRRKRVLVSSDEEDETGKSGEITNAKTLREISKRTEEQRRLHAKDEELKLMRESSGEEEEEDEGSDSSSVSSPEKLSAKEMKMRDQLLHLLNSADRQELAALPRANAKPLDKLIAERPYASYDLLEKAISAVSFGPAFLTAQLERLEKRGILERVLDACRQHNAKVQTQRETLNSTRRHASLLNPSYTLHEYQQSGLNWLVAMHHLGLNAILGDEMGLGKTIQVIAFVAYLKEHEAVETRDRVHLIVVPSSTIENWMNEFARWAPDVKVFTYYGSQDERRQLRIQAKKTPAANIDVVLTTYNMLTSSTDDRRFFKAYALNYVIYDEGHMLKNPGTTRYKQLIKIRSERKILLTGTPLQNNLIELVALIYFTIPKLFEEHAGQHDVTDLLQEFKSGSAGTLEAQSQSKSELYTTERIEQAKAILQPYMLRRLKSDVLGELPEKTEEVVHVEMTEDQKGIYGGLIARFQSGNASSASSSNDSENGEDVEEDTTHSGRLMQLRQAANHPLLCRRHFDDETIDSVAKVLAVKSREFRNKKWEHVAEDLRSRTDHGINKLCAKYKASHKFLLDDETALGSGKAEWLTKRLKEIKKMNEKVLIFSQFTMMLDVLEVFLELRGYKHCRMDGQTPVMERQQMVNDFNQKEEIFVFLLSTRAGGLGINLTAANHIILHDIDYNPYNDKQAEDRCHRMGQKKTVHVTRLVSKDTVEEAMYELARRKLRLESDVVDSGKESSADRRAAHDQLLQEALRRKR